MSWAGILTLLGWPFKLIGRLFDWLLEKPIRGVIFLFALHIAAHQFVIDPSLRADRDKWQGASKILAGRVVDERAAHQQTKAGYRAAQAEAARLEAARLARVGVEQQEITDEVTADYRARLADARAHAERLREQLAARTGERAAGAASGVDLPGAGGGAGGAAAAPGDHRLRQPAELDWRLIATEQAIQLDALIDWVERQQAVNINEDSEL